MALKDICVHVDSSDPGLARLQSATSLAVRHGARLTVLHVRDLSIAQRNRLRASELGLVSGHQTKVLNKAIERELDAGEEVLRDRLVQLQQQYDLTAQWLSVEGLAHKVVPQYSRYSDLTIIGHDPAEDIDLPDEYCFAETMVFTSGRPVLIVPVNAAHTEHDAALGSHIAVAWNGSRPAARALSDSLSLIDASDRTTILLVDPDGLQHPDRIPPCNILEHLGRHAANIDSRILTAGEQTVANILQSEALALGADMLVAGTHGRPGLLEKLLGSVTRDLFKWMRLPLLLSY